MKRSLTFGLACFLVLVATALHGTGAVAEVDHQILRSEVLGEDRPLNIVLPADYSLEKSYAVVYALDGGIRYTPTLAAGMHAAYADLIVVGVQNVDRDRDMFPRPLPSRENKGGGGARFLEFLTTELIPYVEGRFSVSGYRVLSGQSNSGFFVLYAMLNAADEFDAYLASSPMIGWDWDMIRSGSVDLLKNRESFPRTLFMNQGGKDYDQVTEYLPRFAEVLREITPADFHWKVEAVEGDGHVPRNSFENGIAFIFGERDNVPLH